MSFAYPSYLYLLLVVPVLGALLFVEERRRERRLSLLGDMGLLRRLSLGVSRRQRRLPRLIGIAGMVCLIVGLAAPRYGERTELLPHRGLDVVFAIDVSASMRARDVRPDRLTRTKAELSLLLDNLRQNRVGVVAFAGTAFVQCPLTTDLEAVRLFLNALDPAVVPQGGTDLAAGLLTAHNLFEAEAEGDPAAREAGRLLVIVTDGEDHIGGLDDAAVRLRDAGIEVIVLGVGSVAGEPIPELDGAGNIVSYKRDRRGDTVMTRLSWPVIDELARNSGGVAVEVMGTSDFGASVIEGRLAQLSRRDFEARVKRIAIDRAAWPLSLAFLLLVTGLLLSERRRVAPREVRSPRVAVPASVRSLMAAIAVLWGTRAGADVGWLERVDPSLQAGAEALASGDFDEAITRFRAAEPDSDDERAMVEYDVGSALYAQARPADETPKAGETGADTSRVDEKVMQAAAEAFARAYGLAKDEQLRSSAALAEGNAYARSGDLDRAVGAYRRSLLAAADNHAARENLRTTLRALASPPPPPQSGEQQGDESHDEDKQGNEQHGGEQQGHGERQAPPDEQG
ncbi:MAG: vWA domain-containing protein, partial [Myxococcota bacterium]